MWSASVDNQSAGLRTLGYSCRCQRSSGIAQSERPINVWFMSAQLPHYSNSGLTSIHPYCPSGPYHPHYPSPLSTLPPNAPAAPLMDYRP
jgi:hypothetical protein